MHILQAGVSLVSKRGQPSLHVRPVGVQICMSDQCVHLALYRTSLSLACLFEPGPAQSLAVPGFTPVAH